MPPKYSIETLGWSPKNRHRRTFSLHRTFRHTELSVDTEGLSAIFKWKMEASTQQIFF